MPRERNQARQIDATKHELPDEETLEESREQIGQLLDASDRIFDAIEHLDAERYLEQNVQSGGQ